MSQELRPKPGASPAKFPPQSTPELDYRILRSLRRIIRAIDIHSRKLSTHYRVTTPQLIALLCVVSEGRISASELSRQINLSNSTIVGILDRLEAKGLVRRERGTGDRRFVYIVPTPAGQSVAQSAPSPVQDELRARLALLPASEQEQIAQSLERIVHLMQAQEIEAAPILEIGEIGSPT